MGLVQGYDAMGIALSKPNLRAELEADLKRICDGVRDPKDVLREQIGRYRHVFVQAMEQVNKIDEALSEYIDEARQVAREMVPDAAAANGHADAKYRQCPQCSLDMVLRKKKDNQGFFFTCVGFPECKTAIWLPSTVLSVDIDPQTCRSVIITC